MTDLLPDLNSLTNDAKHFTWPIRRYILAPKEPWAHLVTQESCPALFDLFQHARNTLGLRKQYKLVLYKGAKPQINAAAMPIGGYIFLSTDALEILETPNIMYLFAHELAHILHGRRQFLRSVALPMATAFGISQLGISMDVFSKKPIAGTIQEVACFGLLLMLLGKHIGSQLNEYEADNRAMDVVMDPKVLEQTLALVENFYKTQDRKEEENNIPLNTLKNVVKTLLKDIIYFLSQDHPRNSDRIIQARQYCRSKGYTGAAEEQGTGR